MNEKLIVALRNDTESANADYSTPLTLGNHLDAAADALEMADVKLHEQDLRIADLVAHLNAEQAKVARLVAENEELKRRLDENIGASKLWNQKYYNLAAERLDTTYAHICDLLAAEKPGRLVVLAEHGNYPFCCAEECGEHEFCRGCADRLDRAEAERTLDRPERAPEGER